jgi:hypothetical protein
MHINVKPGPSFRFHVFGIISVPDKRLYWHEDALVCLTDVTDTEAKDEESWLSGYIQINGAYEVCLGALGLMLRQSSPGRYAEVGVILELKRDCR